VSTFTVTPAQAGAPLSSRRRSGIPAFAGMTKWVLALLATLLFAVPAPAQTFPPLTGRVVDQAHLLTPSQERRLPALSDELERATSDQLVIVTLKTLGNSDIADFGKQLGNYWGIGQKRLDNGVLLIVAPNDHKTRIAVGRGLEGLLTDQKAAAVIADMLPDFRTNRYAIGIERGEKELIAVLVSDKRRPQRKPA